jgi:hypothetical protein
MAITLIQNDMGQLVGIQTQQTRAIGARSHRSEIAPGTEPEWPELLALEQTTVLELLEYRQKL